MIIDDYLNYEIEFRKKYGEKTLILIQVGSFFELYSINENCSFMNRIGDICNIQISKKNKAIKEVGKNNPLMAGFPLYALNKFIQILSNHQFTVVLIEQITAPPNPQRKITEIISPSTNINNNIRNGNYILVYLFEEVKGLLNVGISGVDLTTGNSFVYENGSNKKDQQLTLDECYRILSIYNPTEVLLISDGISDEYKKKINEIINVNCLIHRKFEEYDLTHMRKLEYQRKILEKSFKNSSMLSIIEFLNMERMTIGIMSFCCLLQFAYEHNADIIKDLNIPIILENTNKLLLEYNSAIQLNLVSYNNNDKTLMEILNRTSTAFGSRGFKERLLNPICDKEELNRRYGKIEELLKEQRFKLVGKKLNNINDLERIKRKILLRKIHPSEFVGFISSLEFAMEAYEIIGKDTNEIRSLIQSFSNLNLDECSKYNLNDIKTNIFKEGYSQELDELMNDYRKYLRILDEIVDKISGIDDTSSKLEFNEKDGYFISITKKRFETAFKKSRDYMSKFDKRLTTNNSSYKLTSAEINEASTIIERRQEEISKKVNYEYLNFLTNISSNQMELLMNIIKDLTELDISVCNARNAYDYQFYRPQISDDNSSFVKAENLRHPIIERLITNVEYIGNDISLNQNGILLYGINASGKSSLMKALGLAIIMVQSGMYVPATSFEFSPYHHIFTRICGNDDIYRGMSSFVVEMSELRNILQRADERSLVIGDEICCGTEAISAVAIVSSAINELIKKGSSFIFTSHLHDLTSISIIRERIGEKLRIFHIHIEIVDDKIVYERKLREGQGSNVYGIDVCGSLDMPIDFMKNAENVRKELMGMDMNLINTKKSNYKSSIYMDMCQVCNERPAKETHHINYQVNADENGKFSNFDKNIPHNLISICEECHKKEHQGEIGIIGYKQTSKGVIIEIDKTARIYKLMKRGKNGWYLRKKISDKFKEVDENEIIEFYNKQMKTKLKEISVEMERDFYDISL